MINNQFVDKGFPLERSIVTVCFLRVRHLVSKLDVPRKTFTFLVIKLRKLINFMLALAFKSRKLFVLITN